MNTDTQPYIKWLTPDGRPCHGGTGVWPLPTQHANGSWTPGAPLRVEGALVLCRHGLHLCRLPDAPVWIGPGAVPFLVQYRGPIVVAFDKVVVGEARLVRRLLWDDRLARLFAADCAERALDLYGGVVDSRSRAAVGVARRYANGLALGGDLAAARAAARDAAAAAAAAAAASAAASAAWSAAAAAARDAAAAAARDAWSAARDAWSAARDAAWDAERQWQGERLWAYFTGQETK